MSRRRTLFALCTVALTAVLLLPEVGSAQFRGWGGRVMGGLSNYGGFGNYGGMGYGWGNYGGWGYPANYGNYGWSNFGGTPYYGGNWVTPGYWYSNPQPYNYSSPMFYGTYDNSAVSSQQAFYPPDGRIQGQGQMPGNRAFIDVHVPPNAEVLFDNSPTQQRGPERRFMTPPLDPNSHYTYKVTAKWSDNGKQRQENRTVRLTPGQTAHVSFLTPQNTDGVQQNQQFEEQPPRQQPQTQQPQQRPQRQPQPQQTQQTTPPDR